VAYSGQLSEVSIEWLVSTGRNPNRTLIACIASLVSAVQVRGRPTRWGRERRAMTRMDGVVGTHRVSEEVELVLRARGVELTVECVNLGKCAEFAADVRRVRVSQLVQDFQGVQIDTPSRRRITRGHMRIGEVVQRSRFVEPVAEVPEDADGLPVAGLRLLVPAQAALDVTEAVPYVRLAMPVIEL
jgi:hypothetical protein